MIFILPLGRQTRLAQVPYVTISLILLTTIAFFMTWPAEKKYLMARMEDAPLNRAAHEVSMLILDPAFGLSPDIRQRIKVDYNPYLFPKAETEALFERANHEMQGKAFEFDAYKTQWKTALDHFYELKKAFIEDGMPEQAPFDTYGFDPERAYFPGLVSYMFLHAGYLHLFFNMFLLWIVGASVEERWGPFLFLILYFSGGMAAAIGQELARSVSGIGLVGASGAVAAIMGAFLIRHYKMPIKFFYFIFTLPTLKTGTASWPAWTLLILWFSEQLVYALFSNPHMGQGVAYHAHIGGFLYGAAIGWFVLRGNVAQNWEKKAATTETGMALRDREVELLLIDKEFDEVIKRCQAQLADSPRHLPALLASVQAHAIMGYQDRVPALTVRALSALLEKGQAPRAAQLYDEQAKLLTASSLADKDAMSLSQMLFRLQRHFDALEWCERVMKRSSAIGFRGKAYFLAGTIYKALQQHSEAERCFRTLLEDPYRIEWAAMAERELKTLSQ